MPAATAGRLPHERLASPPSPTVKPQLSWGFFASGRADFYRISTLAREERAKNSFTGR